jgi:hypothetical protein
MSDNDQLEENIGSFKNQHDSPSIKAIETKSRLFSIKKKGPAFDHDSEDDPFRRLEKLILLHSSSSKRAKTMPRSPDVLHSDESEGTTTTVFNRNRFTPPTIRFGPVPPVSPSTEKFTKSAAQQPAVHFICLLFILYNLLYLFTEPGNRFVRYLCR